MKTIIVPTDFSEVSLNAANYAADMACAVNASILLLHMYQIPVAFSEVPMPAEVIDDIPKNAERQLLQLKDDLHKRAGGKLKIMTAVRSGIVIGELSAYCKKLHPYAVVMGSHGVTGIERFLFGSNTILAVSNLSCPVIIVPAGASFTNLKNIGLACDLKKTAKTIPVDDIKKLVKEFGATLHVLHVNADADHVYGPDVIEESTVLQELLQELKPVYHFLNDTEIEEGLTQFAEKHKLDLLIVVPKKHSLLNKLFYKRYTKKIVLHTPVPVMSVHY
ncbi:MAG: universal stress protein [Chitinophagaceae bacterium]